MTVRQTEEPRTLALDAKTGADRSTSPGASPVGVTEDTGVALDRAEHHTLIAYPPLASALDHELPPRPEPPQQSATRHSARAHMLSTGSFRATESMCDRGPSRDAA
ncbi:hypothetical protein [Streptomyces kronopolitis]|uniref:hypothetical protein n=1 Tax=Streptomyces kronopolitis TaxID=1612435 RepID=UPI00342AB0A4